MLPKVHLIYAIIFSIILFPFIKFNVLYFIIGAVLIDVDHYLFYVLRYRKLDIFGFYKYWTKHSSKLAKESICAFHTLEFILLMIILSFSSPEILFFTIGVLVHSALDIYNEFFII